MTLRAISNRDNNVEAQIDGTGRSLRFDKKRQLARLRRRDDSSRYGCVRWFWSTTDLSEAEIVSMTGVRSGTPILVWIDMVTSISPPEIGNAYYRLELVSRQVLRGATTRDLYRAVQYLGRTHTIGTVGLAAQAVFVASGDVKVQTSSGTDITTTINAVAGANQFDVLGPRTLLTTTGVAFDLPSPFRLGWSPTNGQPGVYPEWYSRSRGGCWETGGSYTASIDYAEPFLGYFAAAIQKSTGSADFIHLTGMFIGEYDGLSRKLRVQASDRVLGFNRLTFALAAGGSASGLNGELQNAVFTDPSLASASVSAVSSPVTIATFHQAGGTAVGNLVLTFTEDATTKRISAWSIGTSGLSAGFTQVGANLVIVGGREKLWPACI